MWNDVSLGVFASVLAGIVLWAILPRGVRLTKTQVLVDSVSGDLPRSRWTIQNGSAVSVRVRSVKTHGVRTMREPGENGLLDRGTRSVSAWLQRFPSEPALGRRRAAFRRLDRFANERTAVSLPTEGGIHDVHLGFDDDMLWTLQTDGMPWNTVTIPPGETLTALVPNWMILTIRYRRAGLSGWFERRVLTVYGTK